METVAWLLAALFLPLFPLSMLFNAVLQRLDTAWKRILLLLLWPLPGIGLLQGVGSQLEPGLQPVLLLWACLTSLLYALRSGAVRDLTIWTGYMATSCWALVWFAFAGGVLPATSILLAFGLPLLLLMVMGGEIEHRFESAHASVVRALAVTQPRLATMLILVVLALIASPLFPGFFTMFALIVSSVEQQPLLAVALGLVWLVWSWSAMRLLQGFVTGDEADNTKRDLSVIRAAGYGMLLLLMIVFGVGFDTLGEMS